MSSTLDTPSGSNLNSNFRNLCIIPGGRAEYKNIASIIKRLIDHGKLDAKRLVWIVDSNLEREIRAGPFASSLCLSYTTSGAFLAVRIGKLIAQARRTHPFIVVHAGSRETQIAAALAKKFWGLPIILFRSWLSPEVVRPTRYNYWLNNKATDINLIHSLELFQWHCQPASGSRLELRNHFVIDSHDISQQAGRLLYCYEASVGDPDANETLHRQLSHIDLSYVTHFYFNQENIDAITGLLREYETYDPRLLDCVMFVIVDDASPISYEVPAFDLNLIWLRINEDIPWNQGGARNLGVTYAPSEKILLSDLDHKIPEGTLRYLVKRRSPGKIIYKLRRRDPITGRRMKGHPNLFFMSRSRFFKHFGYDEEFAGNYGFEDVRFIKYQKLQGTLHWHLPKRIIAVPRRNIDKEKGYHSLQRDLSANLPVYVRKHYESEFFGHSNGHSRSFLNCTWRVLTRHIRMTDIGPKLDRGWKRRWLLRQISPWC